MTYFNEVTLKLLHMFGYALVKACEHQVLCTKKIRNKRAIIKDYPKRRGDGRIICADERQDKQTNTFQEDFLEPLDGVCVAN